MNAIQMSRALDPNSNHRDKSGQHVSTVAAFNADGNLLMQRRRDSGKWNLPGGHAMPGEEPMDTARRELKEETGLDAGYLEHLGSEDNGNGKTIHVFKTRAYGEPVTGKDPDNEADKFQWIDPKSDMSKIDFHNRPDIALKMLGIRHGQKETP